MDVDITVSGTATRREGGVTLRLAVEVPVGYYTYTPAATDGRPMQVSLLDNSPFELAEAIYPEAEDGHAGGSFDVTVELDGPDDADEVEVVFAYQVCEPMTCLMPTSRTITAKVG